MTESDLEIAGVLAEQEALKAWWGTTMTDIVLSEHQEQCLVISWCNSHLHLDSRLRLIHAIPNGTWAKNTGTARKAKAEGVKKGVPDLFLPVASQGFHGLYIEMKKTCGSSVSAEQKRWLKDLAEQGYRCEVCKGRRSAIAAIESYLGSNDSIVTKQIPYHAKIVGLNP